MKENEYEQLYYDELYKNKELLNKCKYLEEEINIYKELIKNKPVKKIIAEEFVNYLKIIKKED